MTLFEKSLSATFPAPTMCRLSIAVVGLLSTGTQAFSPITWAKLQFPGRELVMMPRNFVGNNLRSSNLPQQLTIGVPREGKITPYFTPKSDDTISVGGWCVEAAGQNCGDAVLVNNCNGGPEQQWNWIPDSHGRNMIQLKDSNMCLDVIHKEGEFSGARIELQDCADKASESWRYEQDAAMDFPKEVATDSYARHVWYTLMTMLGVGALSLGAWTWHQHAKTPAVANGAFLSVDPEPQLGLSMTTPIAFAGKTGAASSSSRSTRRGVIRMSVGDVTYDDLVEGGATMTEKIIEAFEDDDDFVAASEMQLEMLLARDAEDGKKLQAGIDLAIEKGVLPAKVTVEPVRKINVTGGEPEEIAQVIFDALGDAPSKGCVVTLQGLSGLGKGTTAATLENMLPKAQSWSNGNIFRSLTLLAIQYAIQEKFTAEEREKYKDIITELKGEGPEKNEFDARIKELLTPKQVLTKERLSEFIGMLSFDKFRYDEFDTKIEGLGMSHYVSDIRNTLLKQTSAFVPAIAEVTQGEVIAFIKTALDKMTAEGCNVLMEGREQTLNYIRTPHRFELVTDDDGEVIGMRQAALIIGSNAAKRGVMDDGAVMVALYDELSILPQPTDDAYQKTWVI